MLRHQCPIPMHVLRTFLLGQMASPRLHVSPLAALKLAWGGELPEFVSDDDVQAFMQAVIQGLWNRLSEHQSLRHPFRLPRLEVAPDRRLLHDLAFRRAQEVQGFVDGLFGDGVEVALPKKAHDSVSALAEVGSRFDGKAELLADETAVASDREIKAVLRELQKLSIEADALINKVIQSCKQARGQELRRTAPVLPMDLGDAEYEDAEGPSLWRQEEEDLPEIVGSPLSRSVTRDGVTVEIEIYGEPDDGWILEIVDAENASHVWDERFETDQQALTEALRALEEDPQAFFGHPAGKPTN